VGLWRGSSSARVWGPSPLKVPGGSGDGGDSIGAGHAPQVRRHIPRLPALIDAAGLPAVAVAVLSPSASHRVLQHKGLGATTETYHIWSHCDLALVALLHP
jgi:hypothetical protein